MNDPFMQDMMQAQLDMEDVIYGGTILKMFLMVPPLNLFPSKVMKVLDRWKELFKKIIFSSYKMHIETYDPGSVKNMTINRIETLW